MEPITRNVVRENLPRREVWWHKGDFGKVLCVCGSVGYTGAPIFASRFGTERQLSALCAQREGHGLIALHRGHRPDRLRHS